jgi:hypothetical protein
MGKNSNDSSNVIRLTQKLAGSKPMVPIYYYHPITAKIIDTCHVACPDPLHKPEQLPELHGVDDIMDPTMGDRMCLVRHSSNVFTEMKHPFCAFCTLHANYMGAECVIIHPFISYAMFVAMNDPASLPPHILAHITSTFDGIGIIHGYNTHKMSIETYKSFPEHIANATLQRQAPQPTPKKATDDGVASDDDGDDDDDDDT